MDAHAVASTSRDASVASAVAALDSCSTASPPSTLFLQQQKRARREATAVSTPALMSLLPQSRKRRRLSLLASTSGLDEAGSAASTSKGIYRPSLLADLLDRLASFTLTLWNDSKPQSCSAVEFARYGWRCTGLKREEVTCETCGSTWQVENANDWRSEEGKRVAEEIQQKCSAQHGKSCPWRSRPCSSNLYRLSLSQPPSQLLRDVLARAATYPPDLQLTLSHPLTQEQLIELTRALNSPRARRIFEERSSNEPVPSQSSIIASIFGWQVMAPPSEISTSPLHPSSTSVLQCKYCSRRLLAKSATGSTAADNIESPASSPSKLTAVNVKTAHRRFCAYIRPASEDDSTEGWQALLQAIVAGMKDASRLIAGSEAAETDGGQPIAYMETKETLKMVKEMLRGGVVVKRKSLFS